MMGKCSRINLLVLLTLQPKLFTQPGNHKRARHWKLCIPYFGPSKGTVFLGALVCNPAIINEWRHRELCIAYFGPCNGTVFVGALVCNSSCEDKLREVIEWTFDWVGYCLSVFLFSMGFICNKLQALKASTWRGFRLKN